jgi:hypothetical protein
MHDEERRLSTTRAIAGIAVALGALALALGLYALTRDDEPAPAGAPAEGSVGTDALQDGAVTAEKLAPGAVTGDALADGAVTDAKVAPDSLTGASIDESTLERVPSARNAGRLGNIPAAAYLSGVTSVQAASDSNADTVKGPVTASCPEDTIVLAGGASIEGATGGVTVTSSSPEGTTAWTATAEAFAPTTTAWRLVVTAVCAAGGSTD